jgi:hypothetical protein
MKKTIAILMSIAALAYVGIAVASDVEDSANKTEKQNEPVKDQAEKQREEVKKQKELQREQIKDQAEQQREETKKIWEQRREQVKTEWEQKREEMKTEREQALEGLKLEKENFIKTLKNKFEADKCLKIQERVKEKASKFGESKEKHVKVYVNLLGRIDKFIVRFAAFNEAHPNAITAESVAKLKADRDTLAGLIADFKTNYADYFTKFRSAENFTCGQTEGQLRSSLADSKVYLKGVHGAADNIRKFVKNTVLPDILAIKKQIAAAGGEKDDEDDDEEDKGDKDNDESSETTTTTIIDATTTTTINAPQL